MYFKCPWAVFNIYYPNSINKRKGRHGSLVTEQNGEGSAVELEYTAKPHGGKKKAVSADDLGTNLGKS